MELTARFLRVDVSRRLQGGCSRKEFAKFVESAAAGCYERHMEFRILGSLQVLDGGRELPVAAGKLRALLAVLLVHANRPVSEDVLIEALWGEKASAKAADNLHVLVSRLRRALGGERIVREGGGYAVRVGEDELDLGRFEQLRREAKPHEALELWRGPPLAEFTYQPWAEGEIRRLEELRLLALEERIEADLASGRHPELVGELHGLVTENPLREELRRQLILALYRSGRQAEALEAYRAARRTLDEELGLEPSPALRELERAVLQQDSSLDAPRRPVSAAADMRRRRGALVAAAAAALAFGGAAVAVVLLDRGEGDRRASAAPLPRATTTAKPKPVRAARERPRTSTTRVVVIRERPKEKQKAIPRRRTTQPAPQSVPRAPLPRPTARAQKTPTPPPPAEPKPTVVPTRLADNFDDGVRNGSFWHQIVTGTGITLTERNGRLEVEFAPDGAAGGEYNVLGAHYGTQCRFLGNFDARVDYELLEWPATNGVLVQLNAWFTRRGAVAVGRQSQAWDEEYVTWADPRSNSRPTLDNRGSLRIRRVGSIISTHYKSGRQWLSLGSARTDEAPMIGVQAMTRDEWFADRPVRVAFDNFSMTATQSVC